MTCSPADLKIAQEGAVFRGFLAGLFWGGVAAVVGFVGVSLTTHSPEGRATADRGGNRVQTPTTAPATQTPALAPVAAAPTSPAATEAPATARVTEAPATTEMPATSGTTAPVTEAPVAPGLTAPAVQLPAADAPPGIAPSVGNRVTTERVGPDAPIAPQDEIALTAPPPVPAPVKPVAPAAKVPEVPVPQTPLAVPVERDPALGPVIVDIPARPAEPAPKPPEPAVQTPTPRPTPGLGNNAGDVRSDRLPRIGSAPAAPEPQLTNLDSAMVRNARRFDNPEQKPPFAVLLIDTGDTSIDLAAIAGSDLPLTLVVDPTEPGAEARAAVWRAAGQEVALLGSGVPLGGTASDMEVALEALSVQFPQALALIDRPEGGLQGDRASATALIPSLKARGFGMVTWDRGLNAADQVARREGVPAALIFRDLDAKDEAAPVIRRYLDRAAFKAQQDGRAMVIGRLRPETLKAVMEWSLDSRANSLAPAPLTGMLR